MLRSPFVAPRPFAMALALLGPVLLGCGTVDPGPNFQIAEVVFDANFFYCKIEPMLVDQKCGAGDPAKDSQGCHFNVTSFRLQQHGGPPDDVLASCSGNLPSSPPMETWGQATSQANWGAASGKMSTDPDRAPLLLRPTQRAIHPRQIFADKSPQADLIRQWATKYSSR